MANIDSTKEGLKEAIKFAKTKGSNSKVVGLLTLENGEKNALLQFKDGSYAKIDIKGIIKTVTLDYD